MLYPVQTLWEQNVFFQEFPYHLSCECNIIMQDLNWVQHWVSRIGLSVVLHRSPPKHSNQENWSSTHFYWFKSPPWSRKSLTGEAWMPVKAPNIAIASNQGTIVEMSVFKGFILWSLSELYYCTIPTLSKSKAVRGKYCIVFPGEGTFEKRQQPIHSLPQSSSNAPPLWK